MRKKKNLNARLERCAHLLERNPAENRGRWREARMPQASALHLELGCGKGQFICRTALNAPETLFIALERVPEALVMAMEKALALEVKNVRFILADAASLSDLFAPDETDRIYINFCDPWPSKKHAKRRLTHSIFLTIYKRVLKPGGQLHFKTDNADLFEFSVKELAANGFSPVFVSRDLHKDGPVGIMTEYEMKFYSQGVPICRCEAVLDQAISQ